MKAKVFSLVFVMLLAGSLSSPSQAQVTTAITPTAGAGNLGTTVTPAGNVYNITDGTKLGSNLFHSFGLFSVGAGDTANFINNLGLPTSNSNIFSRVTGGNPSNIFGTIQTTGFGSASLYLVNPAGILFGSTASLNVGGSFHASTADYVKMSDGSLFIANPIYENAVTKSGTIATVLSSADPAAFGFLSSNPAPITIQGSVLAVDPGQSLSLVGGDISVAGGMLSAPSGQINLVSVASPGEVIMPSLQYAPNVNGDSFTAMGAINLSGAFLDVSGDPSGTVHIRGGQLVMDSSAIFSATVDVDAPTAVDINVTGDVRLINFSSIATDTFGLGRSGDIVINARNVDVRDLASINTISDSAGPAGNVTIGVSGSVTVTGTDGSGNFSNISSIASSGGDSGMITIHAASVTLDEGGLIRTQTSGGHAGGITLEATGDVNVLHGSLIDIDGSGGGSSGTISISGGGTVSISGQLDPTTPSEIRNVSDTSPANIYIGAGNFFLTDGALIDARTSTGTNGTVAIAASESATINGGSQIVNSTSFASGGSMDLSAPSITIDHATLSMGAFASGDAGVLTVSATGGNLTVSGGSIVRSTTFSSGQGGPVLISASDSVIVSGGSSIESRSTGTGNAGNIGITASDSLVMQNSSITTQTIQSDGGDIHIQVGRLVQLNDSTITTSVQGGTGNGGNITIDPQFVILQNSQIIANAFGGNGGNITIVAGVFLIDPLSVVSASSSLGINGTINIQAPITNLSGTLAPLSEGFLQAAGLLRASCAARFQGGNVSSFVVAGRDGMPLEPGGLLPSPLFIENSGSSRLAGSLNVPDLRVGRSFGEQDLTLAALSAGCAS